MKNIKDVDALTDRLGVEFRTLFLISIGFTKEEAYREALSWAGVQS